MIFTFRIFTFRIFTFRTLAELNERLTLDDTKIDESLRQLEVDCYSSWDRIYQSHRALIEKWRPDVYDHDAALKKQAKERSQKCNEALQYLIDENYEPLERPPRTTLDKIKDALKNPRNLFSK